jgi:hypothetical protein
MENLGTMEPEELLQLLTGSAACAFVIFLFIIVYVLISRRGSKTGKWSRPGVATWRQDTLSTYYRPETSPGIEASTMPGSASASAGPRLSAGEPSHIDVSARLAGTGREAWLEEGSQRPAGTPMPRESLPEGQEVLRMLRDPVTGQIWIQVAGVRYRSLKDIRDRKVGERVLAAITHLLRFSDGMAASDQGVVTLDLPPCDVVRVPTPFGVLSEAYEQGEMMRLMSNREQGNFCIHVVGQCYRRLNEVNDPATGRCILEAVTRLLQFSTGLLATNDGVGMVPTPPLAPDVYTPLPLPLAADTQVSEAAATRAQSVPDPSSQLGQPALVLPDSGTPTSEEEHLLQQLMGRTPSQPLHPIERPSLMSSLRRMRQGSSLEAPPPLNLAGEIDRIFQSKLMASGLTTTNASIEARPDGSVRIRVETDYYDSPDEVPDPYLRDVLKLSIAEWERG